MMAARPGLAAVPTPVLALVAALGVSACADEPAAGPGTAATTPSGESTEATRDLLVGVWLGVALVQDGERETPGEGETSAVVLHGDGTSAFVWPVTDPVLADLCQAPLNSTWTLAEDGTAVESRSYPDPEDGEAPLVWRTVTLDEDSWTFEEGGTLFEHERLGTCD